MNGLQISILLLVLTFALFCFFFLTGIFGGITQERRKVDLRIAKIRGKDNSLYQGIRKKSDERKKKIDQKARSAQSVRKKKLMDTVFNELVLADIMMGPEEFCMLWLCLIFVPAGLLALFKPNIISCAALAMLGVFGPIVYIRIKKGQRRRAFEQQLGDALMVICNCLRSGLSFQQGMETISSDMPAPIGIEFSRVVNDIRYGTTMEAALNSMVDRIKSADLMLAVSAVNIQRQTGGNLSKILDTISNTIRERMKIKGEIRSMTSQGRMSGMIIGALPIAMLVILMVATPDYMSTLFTTTIGKVFLAVAAVMESVGFVVIRKVVTVEY